MKLYQVKLIAMVLLLAYIGDYAYAQESRKITGSVRDNRTHNLISFATVALTDQTTKAIVKSTQTDINGSFLLDNLPSGVFSLRLSFVGYDPVTRDSIVLSNSNDVLNFDDMQMRIHLTVNYPEGNFRLCPFGCF